MPERKLIATLRALHAGGVEFILVGGLAAVLQGAPIDTFDIDVVHSRDPVLNPIHLISAQPAI
jgi:hypothetical protein